MDLQDLDVDADDYGTAAAEDTPARSRRTEQTEADFEKQRASYTARIENGEIYKTLAEKLPLPLPSSRRSSSTTTATTDPTTRPPATEAQTSHLSPFTEATNSTTKLSRKDIQWITSAVGELYFFRRYDEVLSLLDWLRGRGYVGDGDGKYEESIGRWEARCRQRLSEGRGRNGPEELSRGTSRE